MPVQSENEVARRQLERVLVSPGFMRNERLSQFLRFVVEQHLEGRDQELKESVIAVEVFGRAPGFDSKKDPVVRTEAARLRARLHEYYLAEGKDDALIIELPKGGYVPAFRQVQAEPVIPAAMPAAAAPRRWTRTWILTGVSGVAIAAATLALWWSLHKRATISVAILPLTNLSQDSANDYFTDGLTDEIIRDLSITDGLAVRSQTSSFAFKGKPRNVRDAGKQLDVDYILEGSVLRSGRQLRINVQLVRVRDDFALWSGRYDRELTDIFAIQDEISRGIVNSLRLKFGRGRRRYEINSDVYDLYLRARSLTVERGLPGVNASIGALEEVIARDPSFAPAYADLAAAYAARSGEFRFKISDEMSKMRVAAAKAIELDPLLAQAHYAQAMMYARRAQWKPSEGSFRRAIEIDPNRSEFHRDYASFLLLPLGRIEEALRELRTAEKADPLSPLIHLRLAYALTSARQYDEAAENCGKLPANDPAVFQSLDSWCLSRARIGQGRSGEAIQILEAALTPGLPPGNPVHGELGYAYARAGRPDEAKKLATATTKTDPFNDALIFAGLGDKDRTFAALDRATAWGPVRIGRALTFPEYALLHGDPRVKALRKKVGLPE
jgi:adenylate cyclase